MFDLILIGVALALSQGGAGPADRGGAETGFAAEPQTPTGRFTTATEIRPILDATRGNWVALRDYDGQDLLYLTHLLSWRCGLHRIRFAVNDQPLEDWPMPPCQSETASPNALPSDGALPYVRYPAGSVQSIRIELLYDDLGADSASFGRADVLMP